MTERNPPDMTRGPARPDYRATSTGRPVPGDQRRFGPGGVGASPSHGKIRMKELMKAPLERQLSNAVSILLGVVSIFVMDGVLSGILRAVVPFWARIGAVLVTGPTIGMMARAALRDTARARLVSAWSATVTVLVVSLAVGYAAAQPYQWYPWPVVSACWVWFGGSAVVYLVARRTAEHARVRDTFAAQVRSCHQRRQALQTHRPVTEIEADMMGESFDTEATCFSQAEQYYAALGDRFAAELCQDRVTELRSEDPWEHLDPTLGQIVAGLPSAPEFRSQHGQPSASCSPAPQPEPTRTEDPERAPKQPPEQASEQASEQALERQCGEQRAGSSTAVTTADHGD